MAGHANATRACNGRYPMAYFPEADISPNILQPAEHTTRHPDLGLAARSSRP